MRAQFWLRSSSLIAGTALIAATVVAATPAHAAVAPFYLQSSLVSPGAGAGEGFGGRVATSDNGNRLLIGSPASDNSGTNSGALYAADRDAQGAWSVKQVTLPGLAAGDLAGTSVAMNSAGTRAVVGVPGRGTGDSAHPGQVLVVERAGATWSVAANLVTVGAATTGRLGREVTISRDGSTILTYVAEHTYGAVDGGLVLPYHLDAGEWTQDAPVLDPDPSATAFSDGGVSFGDELATNIDGTVALIADGSYDAGAGQPAGVVYAYSRSGSTWTSTQTISAPNSTRQYFGYGLAMDAAGATAIIGAPGARAEHGSAFVYGRSGATWAQEAALQAPEDVISNFGRSVTVAGDGTTVAVGDLDTRGAGRGGGVFTFTGDAGSWSAGFSQTGLTNGSDLEDSLALSASADTLVVGQDKDSSVAASAGRVQVLARSDSVSAPSVVAAPGVTPGDGQLTVSWTAPDAGGLPIDGYQLDYRAVGDVAWTTSSIGAGVTSRLISVANGSAYETRVRAHNAIGWGPFSAVIQGRPGRVPAAPAITSTSLMTTGVTLGWSVVSDGEPLTGNTVDYRQQGSGGWTALSVSPAARSVTVTGLTLGITYEFRVKATNAFGDSTPSGSSVVAFEFAAGAPDHVSAEGGNRQLTVSWFPPLDDGGHPATGYLVQTRLRDGLAWTDTATDAAAKSLTITGLLNGYQYESRVAAVTAVGTGAFSSVITTPVAGVPNSPVNVTAVPSVEAVTVTWASGGNGGYPLTSFVVQWRQQFTVAWTSVTVGPTAQSAAIQTPGGAIETRVSAVNASGSSDAVLADVVAVPALAQSSTVSSGVVRPYRDGFQDSTRIRVASNAVTTGKVRILDAKGKVVASWSLPRATVWIRDWAGRTAAGSRLPNGSYRVITTLSWRSATRTLPTRTIFVATSQVGAPSVSSSGSTVYPARDGYVDRVTIRVRTNLPASGKIVIKSKGSTVWTGKLSRSMSWAVSWNGRKRNGTTLTPGKYTVTSQLKGGEGTARSSSTKINVSSKKLTSVTGQATYSAEAARDDCGGFGYRVCELTRETIAGKSVIATSYYTGSTTDDLLWSAHSLPLPAGTTKWRIKAFAESTDARYVLGYCTSDASVVDDCPSGRGAAFPAYSEGTITFPWTTTGADDRYGDFFVGSYDWGFLYVATYTIEYVHTVLK